MIVIINVVVAATLRTDKIYLGGSLRKVAKMTKKMSEKEKKKSSIAEKKLKNYIQKKYGKIDLGFVSEGVSDAWLRRFYETTNKSSRRIPKKRY